MAVRVWTRPNDATRTGGAYTDYPEAVAYEVDDEHELDLRRIDGDITVTYSPGSWHHVEIKADKP